MGKRIDDGGPAFPMRYEDQGSGCGGMSLRDYFAAAALQGMLAHADDFREFSPQSYAGDAYKYADAMLRARSQEVKP